MWTRSEHCTTTSTTACHQDLCPSMTMDGALKDGKNPAWITVAPKLFSTCRVTRWSNTTWNVGMLIIVSVACSTLVYQTDVCKHAQHPRIPTGLHCFEPNACISFLFSTTHHPPLHPCSVVARVLTAKERQGVDEPSHELQHPMMRDHRTMPSPQHWLVPHSYPSVSLPLPVKLCGRFAIPGGQFGGVKKSCTERTDVLLVGCASQPRSGQTNYGTCIVQNRLFCARQGLRTVG
jgi:hypothetical protein